MLGVFEQITHPETRRLEDAWSNQIAPSVEWVFFPRLLQLWHIDLVDGSHHLVASGLQAQRVYELE